MKKNMIKMLLDIVMIIILVLLYNSHVADLVFHELAGLIVCGLFIIHCLLNRKWIISISKKFFHKNLPLKTRLGYIINLLLLITFSLLVISGIQTSQVLFPASSQGTVWRGIHHCAGALSIILVGIHIGFHWSFISGMSKKFIKIPKSVTSKLNIILIIIVLCFGSYNILTSSFCNWLIEPFVSQTKTEEPIEHTDTENSPTQMEEEKTGGDTETHTPKNGENKEAVTNSESNVTEESKPTNESKTITTTPAMVIDTMTTYLSIIGVFTIISYYIDKKMISKRKRKSQ